MRLSGFFLGCLVWCAAQALPVQAQQIPNPGPRTSVPHNAALIAQATTAFPDGVWRNTFAPGSKAPPLFYQPSGSACPLAGGNGDNGSQVKSADSKCWLANFPAEVDIRQFGADPTGVADARPAINAAFALGSNHTFVFPEGTYTIKSTAASPYPAVAGPVGLQMLGTAGSHLSNVKIKGHNAVITADNANNNSNWMVMDYVDHLEIDGLTFLANKTGYAAGYFPSAMVAWHLTDFTVSNIRLSGDWGGSTYNPAFFRGNWLIGGKFHNNDLPAVGQCFDLAFVHGLVISNNRAVGAGDSGSSAAQPCISLAYDSAMFAAYPAAAPYNFTTTRDVTITGNDISNFVYGISLRAGQRYQIVGNSLHENPGIAAAVPGSGVALIYETAACCPSATDPVHKVTITGNNFADNAVAQIGGGVVIDTTLSTGVASGDFNITGNAFYNNNPYGIFAITAANLSNVYLGANSYAGPSQTIPVSATAVQSAPAPRLWTPTDISGAGLTFANVSARYAMSEGLVHIYFSLDYPTTANGSAAQIQGLPLTVANARYGYAPTLCYSLGLAAPVLARTTQATDRIAFFNAATGANYSNANLSGQTLQCQLTYPAL